MTPRHLLLITYTVYPPEAELESLVAAIERADYYEIDETCWLVYTEESARWWYSHLEQHLLEDDELTIFRVDILDLVSDLGTEEDLRDWLKKRSLF
jgi:hypothetical protein